MRQRKRWGLSLLELLIAFMILFLVSLYCMSMFAQGQRHWLRAQEYSIATFLVNQKMQELLAVPYPELVPGSNKFAAPYDDYKFTMTLRPFETDLYEMAVEVVSRKGVVARATTLVADDQRFYGVAVDPDTNLVAFSRADQTIGFFDDSTRTAAPTPPNRPDGALVGAVAGMPGHNVIWTASFLGGVRSFREVTPNPHEWGPAVGTPPAGTGRAAPRFSGLACDAACSYVLVGDAANRGVWLLVDEGTPSWRSLMRATDPPLGAPSGVATDDMASLVWVADREYQCLRKLLLTTDSLPAAQYEAVPGGYWQRQAFRPDRAVGVLGDPQGIAMDPGGWAVYLADRGRLWRFTESESTKWAIVADFPPALVAAGPSGLALDDHDNVVYISTRLGELWKCTLSGPTFEKLL